MNLLKKVQTPAGTAAVGMLDVTILVRLFIPVLIWLSQGLVGLTNGILRDKRVFHINDQKWMSKYNDQGLDLCTSGFIPIY